VALANRKARTLYPRLHFERSIAAQFALLLSLLSLMIGLALARVRRRLRRVDRFPWGPDLSTLCLSPNHNDHLPFPEGRIQLLHTLYLAHAALVAAWEFVSYRRSIGQKKHVTLFAVVRLTSFGE